MLELISSIFLRGHQTTWPSPVYRTQPQPQKSHKMKDWNSFRFGIHIQNKHRITQTRLAFECSDLNVKEQHNKKFENLVN